MKPLKKIYMLSAIFALIFAACEQPADDNTSTLKETTTLTIRNECFSELIDVKWSGTLFADKDNTLGISSAVTKQVEAGEAYIYFSRKSNPVVARTRDLITIEKDQNITFRFFDNTLIVESTNPENTGSLKELISKLATPSKPVLTAKDGTIEAKWGAVSGATSYRVYCGTETTPPDEAVKTVSENIATITGLVNENTYNVWIQAINTSSESALSPPAQKTLALGIPGAPILTAGNGSINVSWTAVDMASSYKLYFSTTTEPPVEAAKTVTGTSTTIPGLTNGTTYHVWVQAVNSGGASIMSDRSSLLLTLAAPQSVSLTAGDGSINVNWNQVNIATSYKVYFSTTTTAPAEADKTVTGTSATITGLTNGTTYHVWVQSVNSGGTSAMSDRASLLLTLAAPQGVSLTAGNGSINVYWDKVNIAASYKVYFNTTTTPPAEADKTVTGTSTTITGLTNGTTYHVWVQSVNSGGASAMSNKEQLMLTLGTPRITSASGLTTGNGIKVYWEGVPNATSYKVYCNTGITPPAGAVQTVTSSITSSHITGLINGTTYYVWVQAVNNGGSSALSNWAQVIPN
jgi:fibronectin type 3 domain-containing protein